MPDNTHIDPLDAPICSASCSQCHSVDGFWPADYVDNGVGMEKCSPAHCEACGWSEPTFDDFFRFSDEQINIAIAELAEARELLASEKITRNHIIQRGIEMQKERDEAREHLSAAKHFLNKYISERDEAREALREIWQSGDAFLPHVDEATTNRWRRAAGWEE